MSGARNMDISNMTIGVSKTGLTDYLNDIKITVLDGVCNEIDNIDEIIQALNNCWQGESRDRFMEDFATARELIKEDLKSEYMNLESKFQSLFDAMFRIDQNDIYTKEF